MIVDDLFGIRDDGRVPSARVGIGRTGVELDVLRSVVSEHGLDHGGDGVLDTHVPRLAAVLGELDAVEHEASDVELLAELEPFFEGCDLPALRLEGPQSLESRLVDAGAGPLRHRERVGERQHEHVVRGAPNPEHETVRTVENGLTEPRLGCDHLVLVPVMSVERRKMRLVAERVRHRRRRRLRVLRLRPPEEGLPIGHGELGGKGLAVRLGSGPRGVGAVRVQVNIPVPVLLRGADLSGSREADRRAANRGLRKGGSGPVLPELVADALEVDDVSRGIRLALSERRRVYETRADLVDVRDRVVLIEALNERSHLLVDVGSGVGESRRWGRRLDAGHDDGNITSLAPDLPIGGLGGGRHGVPVPPGPVVDRAEEEQDVRIAGEDGVDPAVIAEHGPAALPGTEVAGSGLIGRDDVGVQLPAHDRGHSEIGRDPVLALREGVSDHPHGQTADGSELVEHLPVGHRTSDSDRSGGRSLPHDLDEICLLGGLKILRPGTEDRRSTRQPHPLGSCNGVLAHDHDGITASTVRVPVPLIFRGITGRLVFGNSKR